MRNRLSRPRTLAMASAAALLACGMLWTVGCGEDDQHVAESHPSGARPAPVEKVDDAAMQAALPQAPPRMPQLTTGTADQPAAEPAATATAATPATDATGATDANGANDANGAAAGQAATTPDPAAADAPAPAAASATPATAAKPKAGDSTAKAGAAKPAKAKPNPQTPPPASRR